MLTVRSQLLTNTIAIGGTTYDVDTARIPAGSGFLGFWFRATCTDMKAFSVGWKVKGKDTYQRRAYIDVRAADLAAPGFANFAVVTPVTAKWYWCVLYDPSNPQPFPIISDAGIITFTVLMVASSASAVVDIDTRFQQDM